MNRLNLKCAKHVGNIFHIKTEINTESFFDKEADVSYGRHYRFNRRYKFPSFNLH